MQIVLASTSVYRQELLKRLGIDFICDKAETCETPLANENAEQLSRRLALAKAQNLSSEYPQHLIIGSDQCASLNGEFLSKPGNFEKAFEQLKQCSEQCVDFYTSICLFNSKSGQYQLETQISQVKFRKLSTPEIEHYLKAEQPYDCAGSFKCEGLGISLFKRISSQDPNALIGLPLIALNHMLIKEGINPLAP